MFAQRLTYLLAAAAALSGIAPPLRNSSSRKSYPRSSDGERLRRARQIAKGQLTQSNGLVWSGQVISKPDGKLYLQRPFCG